MKTRICRMLLLSLVLVTAMNAQVKFSSLASTKIFNYGGHWEYHPKKSGISAAGREQNFSAKEINQQVNVKSIFFNSSKTSPLFGDAPATGFFAHESRTKRESANYYLKCIAAGAVLGGAYGASIKEGVFGWSMIGAMGGIVFYILTNSES